MLFADMNVSKFLRSFVIGFSGLIHAIGSEQNMRLHCLAAVGVIVAGFVFPLKLWEWIVILLCIGLVISAECMNTAVERLADRLSREADPLIKQAKDCGSAAVLVLALTAAVVGGMVFVPKMWAAAGW
jgi:diacylglycerol kinase